MKKSTLNVLFFIKKNAAKKNGCHTLMIRLTIDNKQIQFSSRMNIKADSWDQKLNRFTGKTPTIKNLNEQLEQIRMKLFECYFELSHTNNVIYPQMIRDTYLGSDGKGHIVYQFDKYIELQNYLEPFSFLLHDHNQYEIRISNQLM